MKLNEIKEMVRSKDKEYGVFRNNSNITLELIRGFNMYEGFESDQRAFYWGFCMIFHKIAREYCGHGKKDNYIDIIGYLIAIQDSLNEGSTFTEVSDAFQTPFYGFPNIKMHLSAEEGGIIKFVDMLVFNSEENIPRFLEKCIETAYDLMLRSYD